MSESPDSSERRKLLWCSACKKEFFSYKLAGRSECPVCHRLCRGGPPRSFRQADATPAKQAAGAGGPRLARSLFCLLFLAALAVGLYLAWTHRDEILSLARRMTESPPAASRQADPNEQE